MRDIDFYSDRNIPNISHIAKWEGAAWKALYDDLNDKTTKSARDKEKGDRMTLNDVMTIFRQIIGYIARIDKNGAVKVEYVAQDMGVDIVDMRLWLLLMESMNIVALSVHYEYVVLRLPIIDWIGIDVRGAK